VKVPWRIAATIPSPLTDHPCVREAKSEIAAVVQNVTIKGLARLDARVGSILELRIKALPP
jgi:hypothetical protein